MFINNSYSLRMNEVTGYVEDYGKKLSPSDLNSVFIAAKKLIPKLDYQLMIRLLKSDFVPSYNPFYEFFGSDGSPVILGPKNIDNSSEIPTPIIDRLASTIKNDDPSFTKYFVRKWIISIISAAHKVHSPLLLCLLGTQGTGKTEFFRRLLPAELLDYYQESKLDKEKDDELLMTESLIIMDDELGGKSKQDALKLKNMTSKQYFSLRRPYGDHNEKILRLAVLCGTSNFKEILVDQTGNRRVIPIEVFDIDLDEYNAIDKKEMMMEAYTAYRAGFDWRVGREDMEFLNKDEAKYESISREGELIVKYFAPTEDGTIMLSTTEILVEIERLTNQRLNITSISREMGKLGFIQKIVRGERTTVKKWIVKRTEKNTNLSESWKD
jgi:predicted P-loop ATPase